MGDRVGTDQTAVLRRISICHEPFAQQAVHTDTVMPRLRHKSYHFDTFSTMSPKEHTTIKAAKAPLTSKNYWLKFSARSSYNNYKRHIICELCPQGTGSKELKKIARNHGKL